MKFEFEDFVEGLRKVNEAVLWNSTYVSLAF